MARAAPRGSLFSNFVLTNCSMLARASKSALRMSFCKAFWVLGFVERACSNICFCSRTTVFSICNDTIQ